MKKTDFIENRCVPNGLSTKKLQENANHWVIFTPAGLQSDYEKSIHLSKDDSWVYSLWKGYLDDERGKLALLRRWFDLAGVEMQYIHTSGHASKPTLLKFSQALNPKAMIPVHSFDWDHHLESFRNVIRLNNGETFQI